MLQSGKHISKHQMPANTASRPETELLEHNTSHNAVFVNIKSVSKGRINYI